MKLIFRKDDFRKKFDSIKDKEKRLKWAKELSDELDIIYRKYDDNQYEALFKEYKLNYEPDILQCRSFIVTENKRTLSSKYDYFIIYLEHFLPFINAIIMRLEVELSYEQTRLANSKNELTDEQKYPLCNYDYDRIKSHCENVFPVLSDKIKYYDYIIRQFNNEYKGRKFVLDNINGYAITKNIKTINRELKSFKLNYDLEKDKMLFDRKSNTKTSVKKRKSKFKKKTPKVRRPYNPKLIWLGEKRQLIKLLKGLQDFDYLDNQLEEDPECEHLLIYFADENNNDYINEKFTKKIKWKTVTADLMYLYWKLFFKKMLDEEFRWKKTVNIFLNRHGRSMKNLSVSFNALPSSERPQLDSIIKSLK